MISSLRGTAEKGKPGMVTVDVAGVGYAVSIPLDAWETLEEHSDVFLHIFTYVREDRLDLFGFLQKETRTLFVRLIEQPGIGPKTALELCAVPRHLLLFAIEKQDQSILSRVRGVGKKTALKLLVELKALAEKEPEIFGTSDERRVTSDNLDPDAVDALKHLGFSMPQILRTLESLPDDVKTTEARVTAALRSF